jgi:predicted DsbA family dithiol-disulfide isomerase
MTERRTDRLTQPGTYKMKVYFDYACPYAWAAQLWLDQVQDELGDAVDITWRFFPLEQVNHPDPDFRIWDLPVIKSNSTLRSFQAFHAARMQGGEKLRRFHAAMFRKRHEEGRNLGRQQVLEAVAVEAGLDLTQFRNDLELEDSLADIERDYTEAQTKHQVFGTPTIVFSNGEAAYLKLDPQDIPEDSVTFFHEFVSVVRNRPEVIEIKRPAPVGG